MDPICGKPEVKTVRTFKSSRTRMSWVPGGRFWPFWSAGAEQRAGLWSRAPTVITSAKYQGFLIGPSIVHRPSVCLHWSCPFPSFCILFLPLVPFSALFSCIQRTTEEFHTFHLCLTHYSQIIPSHSLLSPFLSGLDNFCLILGLALSSLSSVLCPLSYGSAWKPLGTNEVVASARALSCSLWTR